MLLSFSVAKGVRTHDSFDDTLSDIEYFTNELTTFFNNIEEFSITDYELLYNENDIYIYRINNIYFLVLFYLYALL